MQIIVYIVNYIIIDWLNTHYCILGLPNCNSKIRPIFELYRKVGTLKLSTLTIILNKRIYICAIILIKNLIIKFK